MYECHEGILYQQVSKKQNNSNIFENQSFSVPNRFHGTYCSEHKISFIIMELSI